MSKSLNSEQTANAFARAISQIPQPAGPKGWTRRWITGLMARRNMRLHIKQSLMLLTVVFGLALPGRGAEAPQVADQARLIARNLPDKRALAEIPIGYSRQRISVKFHDGTDIRAVAGQLRGQEIAGQPGLRAVLAKLGKNWRRAHTTDDETLHQWRVRGEAMAGEALPDLRLQFEVTLPPGLDALQTVNALNALDCVEYAAPVPEKVSLPLTPPPERVYWQDYLQASPAGIDADYLWATFGTRGAGVRVVDIEYDFNANHADLPAISLIPGGAPYTAAGNDHGTAVFGIMAMKPNNGIGGNGIAPDAQYYFAYALKTLSPLYFDVGDAIVRSMPSLNPGDIILVEQQIAGPNANETTQEGYVSIEWFKPWYDAVKTAIANGFIVVLPAGNGYRNLDDPMYATGNGGHYPFLAQNDSGAIYVGAGASSPDTLGSDVTRARLPFSNYGSRVNVQGYGERVYTAGYGLESSTPADPNYHFTWNFRGTSSAAPIVTGAAALMQSAYKQRSGRPGMNSRAMRAILEGRGVPQQTGVYPVTENIGPLPNLREALLATYPTWQPLKLPGNVRTGPLDDFDGDGVANLMEFALGMNPQLNTQVGLPVVDFPGGVPRIFYQTDWSAGTTRYIPESSTDLVNWTGSGLTIENLGRSAWAESFRVTAPADGPRRFLRLRVEQVVTPLAAQNLLTENLTDQLDDYNYVYSRSNMHAAPQNVADAAGDPLSPGNQMLAFRTAGDLTYPSAGALTYRTGTGFEFDRVEFTFAAYNYGYASNVWVRALDKNGTEVPLSLVSSNPAGEYNGQVNFTWYRVASASGLAGDNTFDMSEVSVVIRNENNAETTNAWATGIGTVNLTVAQDTQPVTLNYLDNRAIASGTMVGRDEFGDASGISSQTDWSAGATRHIPESSADLVKWSGSGLTIETMGRSGWAESLRVTAPAAGRLHSQTCMLHKIR